MNFEEYKSHKHDFGKFNEGVQLKIKLSGEFEILEKKVMFNQVDEFVSKIGIL